MSMAITHPFLVTEKARSALLVGSELTTIFEIFPPLHGHSPTLIGAPPSRTVAKSQHSITGQIPSERVINLSFPFLMRNLTSARAFTGVALKEWSRYNLGGLLFQATSRRNARHVRYSSSLASSSSIGSFVKGIFLPSTLLLHICSHTERTRVRS